MIIGIGTDLVEIERVKKACENEAFLTRYFTEKEIDLIKSDTRKSASNFAVKEAVSKVFGTGFGKTSPIDIEVLRDKFGKPYVNLYNDALSRANEMNIKNIHISISNTNKYVQAFAIGESI